MTEESYSLQRKANVNFHCEIHSPKLQLHVTCSFFAPTSLSRKWELLSCVQLFVTPCHTVHGILQVRILASVTFPFFRGSSQPRDRTQVSCIVGGILYQLSHKRSPRILKWVVYPFSSESSWKWAGVSSIADGSFTNWAIRETQEFYATTKDDVMCN